ncbi:MAG TPA: TonB family protein, partial [Steroidobacteraceae bacterium]|nr:TonB family protein [Steroidobacteraceae bacterium]
LLIDTASATDVGSMVAQLTQHFPDMVVVVAGKSEDSQALMRLTASGQIYRFLLQPLSQGQTRLTLEAAVNRHQELGSTAKRLATSTGDEGPKQNYLKNGAIAAAAVIALIGIIWFVMSRVGSDKSSEQPTVAEVKKDPAEAELALAKKALDAGKLVEPAGESALDLYRSALSIDPRSQKARDGIKAVADKILERGEKALIAEKLEEAVAAIELARDIQPDHPRLSFLDEQIKREGERLKLTKARDINNKVSSLVAQASQRMEQDKLIAPAGESARDALAEARKLDPTDPSVVQANRDLINRVVEAAKQSVTSGNLEQAQTLATAARQMGYGGSGLVNVDRALTDARTAASKRATAETEIATARKRINDGQLVEPAGDSAKDHITAARNADPTRTEIAELNTMLANKLVDQGKQALAGQSLDRAKFFATAARDVGARNSEPAISQLERDIDQRRASAATAAATKPAATATVAAAPTTAPMGTTVLKRTKYVLPEFPETARRKSLTGWVEVSFTVNAKGAVEDAQVRASSPEDVFDAAALRAVRQWKYEPPMLDGKPTAQRSAARLK